jgi:hydroxyacylglutathione hydrolase
MILQGLVVGPFASNCYIVGSETGREGMVIDPGADAERIVQAINKEKLDIKHIVLTHGHIDHISGVKGVREATGAALCIHADDRQFIQEKPIRSTFGASYPSLSAPERLLQGGDSVDVGDLHFMVLHTPGHTPGGICLMGHGVVFSGDTLFNYGIGRTDFPGGSTSQLMNSIHTKLMILPDNTAVYPGHGPATTIGTERRGNPFLRS